jgi:hypothetical protein
MPRSLSHRLLLWRGRKLFYGALVALLLLTGIVLPKLMRAKTSLPSCFNYLRTLQSAKEAWALEHRKAATDPTPSVKELMVYLHDQERFLECPRGGGKYVLGKVIGDRVQCGNPQHNYIRD